MSDLLRHMAERHRVATNDERYLEGTHARLHEWAARDCDRDHSLAYLAPARVPVDPCTDGEHAADDGHTFQIAVRVRMSSRVVGERHHVDADHFSPPMTLEVRAWDLPAALREASTRALNEWEHEGDSAQESL